MGKGRRWLSWLLTAGVILSGIVPVTAQAEPEAEMVWEDAEQAAEDPIPVPEGAEEVFMVQEEEEEVILQEEAPSLFGDELNNPVSAQTALRGACVSDQEFQHWKSTGQIPQSCYDQWIGNSMEEALEFLQKKDDRHTNTYILMAAQEMESLEQMEIPQGITVGFAMDQFPIKVFSLDCYGDLVVKCSIETQGRVFINTQGGSLELAGAYVDGVLDGRDWNGNPSGTVKFTGTNYVGGIQNVDTCDLGMEQELEKLCLLDQGQPQFHTIVGQGSKQISIKGYDQNRLPVFNQDFDLGMEVQADGSLSPHTVRISYGTDPQAEGADGNIELNAGQKLAVFPHNGDALSLQSKVLYEEGVSTNSLAVDYDGVLFQSSQGAGSYHMYAFSSVNGISAGQWYNAYGRGSDMQGLKELGMGTRSMDTAQEILKLAQDSGLGEGFYLLTPPLTGKIGTVSLPEKVRGLKIQSPLPKDGERQLPILLTDVTVNSDQELGLVGIMSSTVQELNLHGLGTVSLINCRLDQKITAQADVEMAGQCSVKSVTGGSLLLEEGCTLAVEELVKADTLKGASVSLVLLDSAQIQVKTMDMCRQGESTGEPWRIYRFINNGKIPDIFVEKRVEFGKDPSGEDRDSNLLWVINIDREKAVQDAAPMAGDIYGQDYHIWDEQRGPDKYLWPYEGELFRLLRLGADAADSFLWDHMVFSFGDEAGMPLTVRMTAGSSYQELLKEALPGYQHTLSAKEETRYTAWSTSEDGTIRECKAYVSVRGGQLAIDQAVVSGIGTSYYTGKPIVKNVTVKLAGKTLVKDKDYRVVYKNNTKAGTATVVITGMGAYKGNLTKTFKIIYRVPGKGSTYTVGALKYKVTKSAASNGTVQVASPKVKSCTGITVPSTVKIRGYTFKVTSIGPNAFKGCTKLKKAVIGNNITHIYTGAFYGNSQLSSIKLGTGVTHIYGNVFYGCKKLKTLIITSQRLKAINVKAFSGMYARAVIKVPSANLAAYKKLLKGRGMASTVKIVKI